MSLIRAAAGIASSSPAPAGYWPILVIATLSMTGFTGSSITASTD
jgi:hypothetical protein